MNLTRSHYHSLQKGSECLLTANLKTQSLPCHIKWLRRTISTEESNDKETESSTPDKAKKQFSDGQEEPKSIQALYYEPLRIPPTYGITICDLQLRSYHVRSLEFFADFSMRAAYYLRLPALGPSPLPNHIRRWTVPRSPFVHKKSQENFERITHKRLVQIKDGDTEVVERWLAFLADHQFHGVGMKANVFKHEELGVGKRMKGATLEELQKHRPPWQQLASQYKEVVKDLEDSIQDEESSSVLDEIDRDKKVMDPSPSSK